MLRIVHVVEDDGVAGENALDFGFEERHGVLLKRKAI